jgi:hypothetical protein
MLVLLLVLAMAGAASLSDALFAQQLANTRVQQQRAMGMAELGLRLGMRQLELPGMPPTSPAQLRPDPASADTLELELRPGASRVPPGFSAGQFITRDYEIHSTGRSARGVQRTLVQGVTRLEPLAPAIP